ncbi:hypothetical protein MXF13_02100 [Leclercia adecarboxylata]|uniref:hypothetical protein n=1 Tax=Leclercia adecarboxylata TaxID=83655 RepID=UPI002DB754E7|nr:hypothetical protein [Leclercia adecarboxylata]MEB5748681.1 hypothetical protein [Leclercia adecarboxylata]
MLDFVRDIFASFRQTSLERIKSPFLGAFVFSWIGFNWQMLSILFFSKKEIEQRIELINKSYDIGSYLVAPIFTTALIVILLPQINKLITKIQDKPNSETVELSLSSKIKIAELQQSIAEIEARKKLADKKEERNIEEGIANIKLKLEQAINSLQEKNEELQNSLVEINDLHGNLAKAESKLILEKETRNQIQKELTIEKENNHVLGKKLLDTSAEANKYQADFASALEIHQNAVLQNKKLIQKIDSLRVMMDSYIDAFPELFQIEIIDDTSYLTVKQSASPLLTNVNNSLKSRNLKKAMNESISS